MITNPGTQLHPRDLGNSKRTIWDYTRCFRGGGHASVGLNRTQLQQHRLLLTDQCLLPSSTLANFLVLRKHFLNFLADTPAFELGLFETPRCQAPEVALDDDSVSIASLRGMRNHFANKNAQA